MYNRVYIPFPGPPALKLLPPPIIIFKTHIATKSESWWEQPSKPITTCDNSGKPLGPAYTGTLHSSYTNIKFKIVIQ